MERTDRTAVTSASAVGIRSVPTAVHDLSSDFQSPVKMRSQRPKLSQRTATKSIARDEAEAGTSLARATESREKDNLDDRIVLWGKVDSTTGLQSTASSSGTVFESHSDLDGSDGKRRCPSCCRCIASTVYSSHVISCLRKFSRNAASSGTTDDDEASSVDKLKITDPSNSCVVCEKYIGHMNDRRREQHMNRCLDSVKSVDQVSDCSSSSADVLPCPLCNIRPKTRDSRISHIKKCAAKAGVAADKLLDAIRLLDRQAKEREEAGLPPLMPAATSHLLAKRRGGVPGNRRQQRRNGTSDDNDSEEMDVAVAMSLSEQPNDRIRNQPADVVLRRRRKDNKRAGPPLLLLRSEEDRAAIIAERIAQIVTEQQSSGNGLYPVDWSFAPRHVSRFKDDTAAAASECRLWNLASLSDRVTSDPTVFYVDSLRQFVTPCKVKAGDKMKRLSQVPGYLTQRTPAKERIDGSGGSYGGPSQVGPSTQEIVHILDAVEDFHDDVTEGHSGFFSMSKRDAVEEPFEKQDEPGNCGDDNDDDDGIIILDASDPSSREQQDDEETTANRQRRAAELAESFDKRLKDMQLEFSMTCEKAKTTAVSPGKSTSSSKRKLRFASQPTILRPPSEDDLQDTAASPAGGDRLDLETSTTKDANEDWEMRSLGSPDLFGDDEDLFNRIDLEAIAQKKVDDSNADVRNEKSEQSACISNEPDDSVPIVLSPVGRKITTSTPLRQDGSPSRNSSLRCSFGSPLLNDANIQALLEQDTVLVTNKSLPLAESVTDSDREMRIRNQSVELQSECGQEIDSNNVGNKDQMTASEHDSGPNRQPDAEADVTPRRHATSYNDVWNSFQDDGGYFELPATPSLLATMTEPQSSPGPRIVQCDAHVTTTSAAKYSPGASSSSGRSQEYLPEIDTPFTKDDSFIMEMDDRSKDKGRPKKAKPAGSKRKRVENPVTPMPHYSMMVTPEIRKELSKIGVKALAKAKGRKLLKHVYEETHPLVPCDDADTTAEESVGPLTSKGSELVGELSVSKKLSKRQAETPVKKTKKHKKAAEAVSSKGDLGKTVNNFIKSHLQWHDKIVQYQVIDINVLREDLKSAGFKVSLTSLKNHLDEQCVTYSDLQDK